MSPKEKTAMFAGVSAYTMRGRTFDEVERTLRANAANDRVRSAR